MQWDLGINGLLYLAAMSLAFGVLAALLVGKDTAYRLWAGAITTAACFGVGLFVSEVLFGWATQEELQPNIDGLSRDEALLSGVVATAIVVLVMRYLAHRSQRGDSHVGWHVGRHHHA
jgi:hypothetical protein